MLSQGVGSLEANDAYLHTLDRFYSVKRQGNPASLVAGQETAHGKHANQPWTRNTKRLV